MSKPDLLALALDALKLLCEADEVGALDNSMFDRARDAIAALEAAQSQPTAKQRYESIDVERDEADPVERLRAFCSLAMNGQDWLDVEPFFDAIKLQPAAPAEPVVMLGDEPVQNGWLQSGGLLYRLTDDRFPQNRDEISVTMADGSCSDESRARRAGELLDRLATAPAVELPVVAWQPIETAPRGHKWILVCHAGNNISVEMCTGSKAHRWEDVYTHWMPLPAPPAAMAAAQGSAA